MSGGRPGAGERLARVLELVPWVAAGDGPTRAEIRERFELSDAELDADLGVVWFVGLPPYTPDSLIEVVSEGDRVWIRYPEVFHHPRRLTPEAGVSLLAAAATVAALPGADRSGPLRSGMAKLAAVLGVDAAETLDVDLGAADPAVVAVVREAVAGRRRLRLDHYSYGRDERTVREVDPYRLHVDAGTLYLDAYCHLAGGRRWFRVDRIVAATALEEAAGEPAGAAGPLFEPEPGAVRVTLDLEPSASWVASSYPVESVSPMPAGRTRVTLAVAARPWLERLLLRLGSTAEVVDAPEGWRDLRRSAAARVLGRYSVPPP